MIFMTKDEIEKIIFTIIQKQSSESLKKRLPEKPKIEFIFDIKDKKLKYEVPLN